MSIWPPGRRRQKEKRYKLLEREFEPISYTDFATEDTLFGPRTVGTRNRPKRFDFVATPVRRRAELVVVEVKAGRITPGDIIQLLGYINFLQFLQKYLGKRGKKQFSDDLDFIFTGRTRLSGILIGKKIRRDVVDALPKEVRDILTLCTFKVVKGRWPKELQEVLVHDRSYPTIRRRAKEGKQLRSLLE